MPSSKSEGGAKNALTLYEDDAYAVIKQDIGALPELLEANIGDGGIDEFDLPRTNIPGGGGLAWSVPDVNGEPEAVPDLVGVVLLHGNRRAYWQTDFEDTGGGTPPDCSSTDGKFGTGVLPGIDGEGAAPRRRVCKTCPMAQWGSSAKGDSQACSQRKLVYFMRPNEMLPLVIDLAPSSIKPFQRFMLTLASRGVQCTSAVVGLRLRNETQPVKHSVVSPRLIAVLPEDQAGRMKEVATSLRPYFDQTGVEGAETVTEG